MEPIKAQYKDAPVKDNLVHGPTHQLAGVHDGYAIGYLPQEEVHG